MKYEDTLYHWNERKHKYVAKVKTKNGRYRYFYSKQEYQNYMNGDKKSKDNVFGPPKYDFGLSDRLKKQQTPLENFVQTRQEDFIKNVVKNDFLASQYEADGDFKRQYKYIDKIPLGNGTYRYFYSQAEYDSYLRRKKYQENEPDFMKDVPELSDSTSWTLSSRNINTDRFSYFDTLDDDGKTYNLNCMLCTTAYELAQRGYKVNASYMSEDRIWMSHEDKLFGKIYKKPLIKWYDIKQKKGPLENDEKVDIYKFIKDNNPPNARGNLMVRYEGRYGHSVAYETDSKGNVRLVDTQLLSVVDKKEDIDRFSRNVVNAALVRTDNLELKEGILDCVEFNGK